MISFRRQKYHPIGIQVGPRSISMVQLMGGPGELSIVGAAHTRLSLPDGMSVEEQDRQRAQAMKKLMTGHRFHGNRVVSCLSDQDLFVQNVRLPQLPDDEIEKVVRWEAEERLPYALDEAEIRYLPAGEVRQDTSVKQEVILLGCHQGVVERQTQLLKQAGLVPAAIDVEPCAILRTVQSVDGSNQDMGRNAYLNFGDKATTVMFADNDQVLFLKYVMTGGQQLDQAVSRTLDLPIEEAARMRAIVTASPELNPEDDLHCSVVDAIRTPLESISSEIELCLRYYAVTFRGKPLEKVILTGSEASFWLIDFLAQRLRLPCELGNPFSGLATWPTSASILERPWRWATPFGLSLRNVA